MSFIAKLCIKQQLTFNGFYIRLIVSSGEVFGNFAFFRERKGCHATLPKRAVLFVYM